MQTKELKRGSILVLSGPSGAGKSTVIAEASEHIGEFYFSISTTTRAPRVGEQDGKEYFFVTKEEFERGIGDGEFLEYAIVHGNYYGTSLSPVKKALKQGKLVIFDIDVQGHRLVRQRLQGSVTSVFLTPPSISELERRLTLRGSDDAQSIKRRIKNAKEEIEAIAEYDFVIVNNQIKKAAEEFAAVANTAKLKYSKEQLAALLKQWLGED